MNPPPGPPDPYAYTEPIPVVNGQVVPPRGAVVPPPGPASPGPRKKAAAATSPAGGAYVHRFGNVFVYLLRRFCALVVDLGVVTFVVTAFGFNAFDRGFQAFAARNEAGFLTLLGGSFGVALLFAYLSEALTGATLGKVTFALHTRRIDGGHAGGGRVLVRYLLLPIDLLVLGGLSAALTRRHQTLGDLAAGTVVAGSRMRAFAPIVGIALLGALAYAQIAYGGGLTSAIETAAEASNVIPGDISKISQTLGFGALRVPPVPLVPPLPSPLVTPTPVVLQTLAPQAVQPSADATGTPPAAVVSSEPTEAAATDAPSEAPTDAPTDAPEETPNSPEPTSGVF